MLKAQPTRKGDVIFWKRMPRAHARCDENGGDFFRRTRTLAVIVEVILKGCA